MKKLFLIILILFVFGITSSFSDVVSPSPYNTIFDIHIVKCNGVTEVYYNCVVTNTGEWSISFIPDQGRIQTGHGKQIIVTKSTCTSITLIEK